MKFILPNCSGGDHPLDFLLYVSYIECCITCRGKCYVKDAKTNVENLEEYAKQEDTFFYFFAYSPETRRLNSTQGEIRIGPSHQTALPECRDHKPLEGDDSDHPPEQLVNIKFQYMQSSPTDYVLFLQGVVR
jgi:hypothetical protein